MNIGHVRYTVNAEHVAENKANISRVMAELRTSGRTDIRYSVFVEDDGKTPSSLGTFWKLGGAKDVCESRVLQNLSTRIASRRVSRDAIHVYQPHTR